MVNQIFFFLLNGAGTLILETSWLKKQIYIFGSTPESYGSILCAYFLGISVGSWYFRQKHGASISLRKLYAGFMVALFFSLCLPIFLLDGLSLPADFVYGHPSVYKILVWALAIVSVFPACFFLGAFFPLLSQTVNRKNFVFLYGVQTFGALFGIYFGSFYLPYTLGYFFTFLIGIGINIGSIFFVHRIFRNPPPAAGTQTGGDLHSLRYSVLSFLSGFLSLLMQVLWIRFIAMSTDNSIYAFGSASLIILIQLTMASYVTSRLPAFWFGSRGILAGLLALSLMGIILSTEIYLRMTNGLAINAIRNATGLANSLLFAASFITVGYFFPSFIFPFIMRMAKSDEPAEHKAPGNIGALIATNGIGCALGSFLASFVFLPELGIWTSLLLVLIGYSLFILLSGGRWIRLVAVVLGATFILAFNPHRHPLVTPIDPFDKNSSGSLIWVKEGRYGIVSVIDYKAGRRTLWLNNTYQLEAGIDNIRGPYRMGLLPTVLNPTAKNLAMIGVGTGMSSSGFLNSRLEKITLIEMIPEVKEAAAVYFGMYNRNVLSNPRVRTILDDGRHYLKIETNRFDIVCSDLFTPWNEGTANLYTVEHFRNVKEKLSSVGLFCLWLPMYQITRDEFFIIVKSFASVFPHTTVWQLGWLTENPIIALVGTDKIHAGVIEEYLSKPPFPNLMPDIIQIHESGIFSLYVGPVILSEPFWNTVPLNTLNRPIIEFKAAQKNRTVLRGKEMIDLLELFFKLPGNPQQAYFTQYNERLNAYRMTGWDLNQYLYFSKIGNEKKAELFSDRARSLPALPLLYNALQNR